MENLSLDFKVLNIEPPDNDSDDSRGVVDVRFWLRGESWSDVRATSDVRVYFTDPTISVEQIKTEARVVALLATIATIKMRKEIVWLFIAV